jgi:hypothetical protein
MRLLGAAVIGVALYGCATTSVAAGSPGQSPTADYSGPLGNARQRRDAAALVVPPSLPTGASPTTVVSFMKESVGAWVQTRRAAVDGCVEAYRDAGKGLAPPERTGALLEASHAALAFLDAYSKLSDDVASALATDPDMKSELLAAFRESERPHVEMTKGLLGECIASDDRGSSASGAHAECRKLLQTLPGVGAPK